MAAAGERTSSTIPRPSANKATLRIYDRAVAVYDRLVNDEGQEDRMGDWARARFVRADMLLKAGRQAEGVSEARAAYAILKQVMSQGGDWRTTEQWARTVFKDLLDGAHPAEARCRGRALARQGRHDQALAEYDRGLMEFPDDIDLLLSKAIAESALGKNEQALATIGRGLQLRPDHAGLWAARGVALCGGYGQYQEALGCFDKALAAAPRMLKAWESKGLALCCLARFSESVACFDAALRIAPDAVGLFRDKAEALAAMGRWGDCLACCAEGLRRDPDEVNLLNCQASALLRLGRSAEALACYQWAIQAAPAHWPTWQNAAQALQHLGRNDEAQACLRRAEELRNSAGATGAQQQSQPTAERP